MKRIVSAAAMLILSLCLYGQDVKLPNIAAILPAPPSLSDSLYLSDISRYNAGKALRDTERGTVAVEDVSTTLEYFLGRFGKAMGREMTAETYPAVSAYVLFTYKTVRQTIQESKELYARVRPYQQFKESTPCPEYEFPDDFTSYPSGHSARGWAIALALTAIDPDHQEEILKVGYEYGESRVILGYHYESDVEAARIAASAGFAGLCAYPFYLEMMAAAKAELLRQQ